MKFMEKPSGFDAATDQPFASTDDAEKRIEKARPSLDTAEAFLRYISFVMANDAREYRAKNLHFFAEALRDRIDALRDPQHRGVVEANISTRKAAEAGRPDPSGGVSKEGL